MNNTDDFNRLIDLIKHNKEFPYYAAERRIDLFISLYIDRILNRFYGKDVIYVAPEFPIKHKRNNQADKADLLCAFSETKQPIIVEIKTDAKSFKDDQLQRYVENTANYWEQIIQGLSIVVEASISDYRVKYFYLLKTLLDKGLVKYKLGADKQLAEQISDLITSTERRGKSQRSTKIISFAKSLEANWQSKIKILYLIPESVLKELKADEKNENVDFLSFNKISDDDPSENYRRFVSFLKSIA